MMDQRQYRDDQPCGDAVAPGLRRLRPAARLPRPHADALGQGRAARSKAAWKVVGNQVMVMPAKVLGGSYYTFDSWQGYREREELLATSPTADRGRRLRHGRHPHLHRRRRAHATGRGETVALEFVGGSITSQQPGRDATSNAAAAGVIPGNDAEPAARRRRSSTRCARINPWVDQADLDHHGYGLAQGHRRTFDCRSSASRRSSADDGDAAGRRLPLARRARADVDQGRQRPAGAA